MLAFGQSGLGAMVTMFMVSNLLHFVCPVVGIAGAYVADLLFGLEPTVRAQLLLFAALPPAVLNFMVAEVYQQEPEKVASIVMLGNVAAIVFVPVGLTLALAN